MIVIISKKIYEIDFYVFEKNKSLYLQNYHFDINFINQYSTKFAENVYFLNFHIKCGNIKDDKSLE